MFITGIGTALPSCRYTQQECWEAVQRWDRALALAPRSRKILEKVLTGDSGVKSRHFVLSSLDEGFIATPDVMRARFERHAPVLAAEAGENALRAAGLDARAMDAVIVCTCTGYLCPGLSSYVVERMALPPGILALDLAGQGCGAAVPNLRMGDALIRAGRARHVLCICVEICSAAIYLDDDPGVLVSACLFGDGAGAAVLSAERCGSGRRMEWRDAGTLMDPANRDLLRFEQRNGMLRNILTRPVPGLAARHAEQVFREVTGRAGIGRKEIAQWVFHAGGRDVLTALREQFGLEPEAIACSTEVLAEIGNISSPFVLHAMQRALGCGAPGGFWWLASFGAGFASHGVLLEVE